MKHTKHKKVNPKAQQYASSTAAVKTAAIVAETLYNQQGATAFTTVPVQKGDGAFDNSALFFEPNLVNNRDPLKGGSLWDPKLNQMTGQINSWVDTRFKTPDNTKYPYTGSYYENDPLQRPKQNTTPDKDFIYNSGHAPQHLNGYLPDTANTIINNILSIPSITLSTRYSTDAILSPLNNTQKLAVGAVQDTTGKTLINLSVDLRDSSGKTYLLSTKNYVYAAGAEGKAPIMLTTTEQLPNNYNASSKATMNITKKYDALGRLIFSQAPDAGIKQYFYDDAGRLRFMQDAEDSGYGRVKYQVYDALSRLVQIGIFYPFGVKGAWDATILNNYLDTDPSTLPNAQVLKQWNYEPPSTDVIKDNSINRLIKVTNWNLGNSTGSKRSEPLTQSFSYDERGRKIATTIQQSGATAYTTRYTYDNGSNIMSIVYPGNPSPLTLYYGYNLQGTIKSIGKDKGDSSYAFYTYYVNGSMATEELAGRSIVRTFQYNTLNQLIAISEVYNKTKNMFTETLQYRTNNGTGEYQDGNIIKAQVNFGAISVEGKSPQNHYFNYSYDAFGRLTAAKAYLANGTAKEEWSLLVGNDKGQGYDSNGNFINTTYRKQFMRYYYDISNTNKVTKVDGTGIAIGAYSYYNNGWIKQTPFFNNGADAIYDLSAQLPISLFTTSKVPIQLSYDSYGERFEKRVQYGKPISITYIRGLGTHPILEQYKEGDTTTQISYIYGPTGLIAQNNAGSDYFISKDHLGSTRLVYDVQGTVQAYFNYEAFGGLQTGHHNQNPILGGLRYLYTGQEWDGEIETYNYHARQYNPTLGRFLTPDPTHQFASPYVYVGNDPVSYIDITGEMFASSVKVVNTFDMDKILNGAEFTGRIVQRDQYGEAISLNDVRKLRSKAARNNINYKNVSPKNWKETNLKDPTWVKAQLKDTGIKIYNLEGTKRLEVRIDVKEPKIITEFFYDHFFSEYKKGWDSGEKFQRNAIDEISIKFQSELDSLEGLEEGDYKYKLKGGKIWFAQDPPTRLGKRTNFHNHIDNIEKKFNNNNNRGIQFKQIGSKLDIKGPWVKEEGEERVTLVELEKIFRPEQLEVYQIS